MTQKHEIYCFNNGGSSGWMSAIAIADDGHCLAEHCCSHEGFMRHDLGMDGSTWKHNYYDEHFGAGNWVLVWIDDPKNDPRLQQAFDLNQRLAKGANAI
jgi:hypothetical protein